MELNSCRTCPRWVVRRRRKVAYWLRLGKGIGAERTYWGKLVGLKDMMIGVGSRNSCNTYHSIRRWDEWSVVVSGRGVESESSGPEDRLHDDTSAWLAGFGGLLVRACGKVKKRTNANANFYSIYNGARDIAASICDPTWGQHKSYGVSGDGPMGRMLMLRLYNHPACPVHTGRGSSGLVSKVASFLLHTPSSANARKLVASWLCVRRSNMGRRLCGRNC